MTKMNRWTLATLVRAGFTVSILVLALTTHNDQLHQGAPGALVEAESTSDSGFAYTTRVHYFSFSAQTVAPITRSTIERKYDVTSLLSSSSDLLLTCLAMDETSIQPSGKIDEGSIRLRVQRYGQEPLFVDNKRVVTQKNRTWKLSEDSWRRLKAIFIESLPD